MRSGRGMHWLVLAGAILVLLGGAGVGYWLFLSPQGQSLAEARGPEPGPVFELGTIVTDLDQVDRPVYIQVGIVLEADSRAAVADLQRREGAVRNAVIGILRGKAPEDVKGSAGMAAVGSEIRRSLNSIISRGTVKEVYFTQFLVQ